MYNYLYLLLCIAGLLNAAESENNLSFKSILLDTMPFRADGKIDIPLHFKHIKLDIGLSYNAPMSQYWLTHENDLLIFGFEPNPASVKSILQGAIKLHSEHGEPLKRKFIGKSFFLIPCALGMSKESLVKFYVTSNDCGCSSIYAPITIGVEQTVEVPIFSLSDFFDLFPFDTHPIIDYIKMDAQGADLDIAKSGGHYLSEHVIYITLEADNSNYANTCNSSQDIDCYMKSIGFVYHNTRKTHDPTYFNPRFSDYIKHNKVQVYQNG